jgi:hypothetical protein
MAEDPHRRRVAVELNALHWTGALEGVLEGARIGAGTMVYDLNGTPLFERLPLTADGLEGHADVALHPGMGTVLMAVRPETPWNEANLLEEARVAAKEVLGPDGLPPEATERFVAYSHPKLAVQFLLGDEELVMLELWTWRPVPPRRDRDPADLPSHFERWSYLDEIPAETLAAKQLSHESRVAANEALPGRERLDVNLVARDQFAPIAGGGGPGSDTGTGGVGGGGGAQAGPPPAGGQAGPLPAGGQAGAPPAGDQRNLHYSTRAISHATCYEALGQETAEWCVAASVQMLLGFYRYEYPQDRIATTLGLGTVAVPNALPNGQEDKVVATIESMSSTALQAVKTPLAGLAPKDTWDRFKAEILANRPAISFIHGHSRTVAGYTDQGVPGLVFKGLVVYDPYGPSGVGAITLEDIAFPIYTFAFTAQPQLA